MQLVLLLGLTVIGCGTQRITSDPPDPELARLEVTPAAVTMQKDESIDLYAVGFTASGDSAAAAVTWRPTGGTMIAQSTAGHRHLGRYRAGQTCGSYTVIAEATASIADTVAISITCTPVAVASVEVTPASAGVTVGATTQLAATPRAADGTALAGRTVTWATNNPGVATVSQSGLVTGITAGTATITATSETKTGSSAITVTEPPPPPAPVASVTVAPSSATVERGLTVQLTATARDASGNVLSDRPITWTSSSTSTATVSGTGLVTGVATGSATITASSEGKSGTSSITVTASTSTLITDPSLVFAVPTTPKPAYLTPVRLAPFNTNMIRIVNNPGTTFTTANGNGTWGDDARHHYQKDQPWNADQTLIAIDNYEGSPNLVILDAETYQPKYGKCSNYGRYQDLWHPSKQHPNERINVKGTQLSWFDVRTCTTTRSWTLPFAVTGIGPWEGNPSFDGRFVALTDSARMILVDMDPQPPYAPYPSVRIGPPRDLTDCGLSGGCTIDWVSVSPSGKYVVASYDGDYVRVYDVDPATLTLTPRPMPTVYSGCHGTAAKGFIYDLGHADMTMNPFDNNEDVLIGQEHCGNRGSTVSGILAGGVMMVRLRDGKITPLTHPSNEAYPHHISARNYDRPGWVYVGYYPAAGKRFNDEIIAVRLDGSFAVERLAHKHSDVDGCYRCESHAVPSRDGKRVLFASNWCLSCGTGCGSSGVIQAYIVDTRP
jgi:hypothetical protein